MEKAVNRGRKPSKSTLMVIDHLLKAKEAFASDIEGIKPGTASAILRRLEKAGYLLLDSKGAEEKFKKVYTVKQKKIDSLKKYREELSKELSQAKTLRSKSEHSSLPFIELLLNNNKALVTFCILLPLGFLLALSCLIYAVKVKRELSANKTALEITIRNEKELNLKLLAQEEVQSLALLPKRYLSKISHLDLSSITKLRYSNVLSSLENIRKVVVNGSINPKELIKFESNLADSLVIKFGNFVMASGDINGVYYYLAGLFSSIGNSLGVEDTANDIGFGQKISFSLTVLATEGSIENITSLVNGTSDFAIVQSDVGYQAANGIGAFRDKPPLEIYSLATLHQEFAHLLCHKNEDILGMSFRDILNKKKIAVGNSNSETSIVFKAIIEAIEMQDFFDSDNANRENLEKAIASFESGNINCIFYIAGIGSSHISNLARKNDIVFIPLLEDKTIKDMVKEAPYYSLDKIPSGFYGLQSPIETLTVRASLVALEIDQRFACPLLKSFSEKLDQGFQNTVPAIKGLTSNDLFKLTGLTFIPCKN